MVFRLGAGTFALARAERSVEEFFLLDDLLLPKAAETFKPDAAITELLPFKLLGSLTEVGQVNIALASGLLGYALGIDAPWPRTAPATSHSTYTFVVAPHNALDVCWYHRKGQVEIDALVLARRSGNWCLFVLEAKHEPPASLAKTKLAYPVAAVATMDLPADVAIIPVYLRSWIPNDRQGVVRFMITECEYGDPRQGPCPVNHLAPGRVRLLDLAL